ncbi:MAG TPA: isoprenylcysteine carboxylmethyltransferase family protein, partial [Bryobacteraceae bacterium]|nr:isoprenylcysteine carboxylmethyltransferase family protein [Bryobacteraceae bacterium]
ARAVVDCGWAAIGIIWLVSALGTKPTARRIPLAARGLHILVLVLAWSLIFARYFRVGFLRTRFVPEGAWAGWLGCAVAWMGFAFTVWARYCLGRNWSGMVEVKENHTLVRRGPYALVRHPIYTGLSLALLGTAVVYGDLCCLIGALLAFFEWKRKSLMEERFMIEQFGREYIDYRHEVKSLIPFVW